MSEIPRRIRIDLFTPAEKAIYDAVQAVEAAGCDVRLTNAVVLLSDARAWVADFVDGVPPEDHYPRPAPANPGDDAGDLVHAVRAVWLSARTNDDTPRGCYLVDSEPMLRAHAAMRAALAAPANRETAEVHSGSPGGEGDVVGDGHGARGVKAAAPSTGTPTAGDPHSRRTGRRGRRSRRARTVARKPRATAATVARAGRGSFARSCRGRRGAKSTSITTASDIRAAAARPLLRGRGWTTGRDSGPAPPRLRRRTRALCWRETRDPEAKT